MKIKDIKTKKPFNSIFDIDKNTLNAIKEHIEENGFDPAFPIILWQDTVIDGNTRLEAGKQAGLSEVPVEIKEFDSEEQALQYAIHNQRDRRNLTNAELLRCIEALGKKSKVGRPKKDENCLVPNNFLGESRKQTAKTLGVGQSIVSNARTILDDANEETKEKVEKGEMSIDQAAKQTRQEKKQKKKQTKTTFNKTNESIDWAKWSWNPITGCEHNCKYCYARDIANRFYEQGFEPTFHEKRLNAPKNTKIPEKEKDTEGIHNVFLVSMGDMLGKWIPDEWIEKILDAVEENDSWNYIILTKNPDKYLEFEWPENCLLGVTTDTQKRLDKAIEVFSKIKEENIKFISCEPLKTEIKIPENSNIDWMIIGGQSKTSKVPEYQPEWDWIESLMCQCKYFDIPYYWKPNLKTRPKMYPKNLKI